PGACRIVGRWTGAAEAPARLEAVRTTGTPCPGTSFVRPEDRHEPGIHRRATHAARQRRSLRRAGLWIRTAARDRRIPDTHQRRGLEVDGRVRLARIAAAG